MSIIIKIHARQIFDSRGNLLLVDVVTENGVLGRQQFPLELLLENTRL
jgi:enolase